MRSARRGRPTVLLGLLAVLAGVAGLVALPPAEGPRPTGPVPLMSVAAWEDRFLADWDAGVYENVFLPRSKSEDSWDHYFLSYGIDAATAMYAATGKPRYAHDALTLVENVILTARPSRGLPRSRHQDEFLGWASQRSDRVGKEVPLFESYLWRYATRLAHVVLEDRWGSLDTEAHARAEAIMRFATEHVFEKWWSRGPDFYVFRSRTHMAAHWALIALSLEPHTPDPAMRSRYRSVLYSYNRSMPNFPSSLRGQLVENPEEPSAWFWNAEWGRFSRPGQDVAHGNGVISYLVEAHDAGHEWSDADIRRLVVLLDRVVWPPGKAPAAYLDGSGTGTGWFSDGFVKLGRYDEDLQRRLQSHSPADVQLHANGALNAHVLAGSRSDPP